MSRSLSYKGQPVQLYPETDISYEIVDDFVDFDALGTTFSWPIRIPRQGNEWIFHHAGDADTVDNLLKTWDGFEIAIDGEIAWLVSFDLDDADGYSYAGSLTSISKAYFEAKDQKLADLITGTVAYPAGNLASVVEATNAQKNSFIRWPLMHFYGERWLKDPDVADLSIYQLSNVNIVGMLLPVFTIEFVLKKALEAAGIELVNSFSDYTTGTDVFSNLLLVHNRVKSYDLSAGISINIADHVPDMTLSELIKDLAMLTCSSVSISPDQTKLEIRSFAKDINTAGIDLQLKHYRKNVQVSRAEENNIKLSWNLSADKRVEENTVEKLAGTYRGEFATVSAWQSLGNPVLNDYGYIRSIDQFYRIIDQNGSLVSAFYSYPLQGYQSGPFNQKEIQPKLLPATKDAYYYKKVKGNFELSDSSGAAVISGFGDWVEFPAATDTISFEESSSDRQYAKGFYSIASVNAIAGTITLSAGSYNADTQINELLIRTAIDAVIPIIGDGPHAPEVGQKNEGFKGRVMMWHGVVSGMGSTYPFASADCHDKAGTIINKISLSWTGPANNLVTALWLQFVNFFSASRYITIFSSEAVQVIKKLYTGKKARLVAGAIRFKSAKMRFTRNGIEDQEIEGWKI
jgi:hypothetical protein